MFHLIAKTLFGLEGPLAAELEQLGATSIERGHRMVAFRGDQAMMYRANIACRTAVRILKPIATFTADDEAALYHGVGLVDWREHLDADGSLAVDPVVHSTIFTNSLYVAQLTKDAIADQLRGASGRRPSVDLVSPDLRINLHIDSQRVTIYLDSSGESLHKRGYRVAAGHAPLNEVLAAGILRLAGWPGDADAVLADFMCGSGTLVIEAAMLARRIAPGLVRKQFGYMRWMDFAPHRALHAAIMEEARRLVLPRASCKLQGSDLDPRAITAARENAERAGVAGDVDWLVANFDAVKPPAPTGLLVTNPPYDQRMKTEQIAAVYRRIGDAMRRNWPGYTAHVLTGNLQAAREFGLRPSAKVRLFNGPIECRLLKFDIRSGAQSDRTEPSRAADQTAEFRNRLTRMAKHWHRWARRQGITCYRLYDRDIPQVPLAIDWYEGRVLVTVYKRRHDRTEIEQREWLDEMINQIAAVLNVQRESVVLKSGGVGMQVANLKGPLEFDVHEGDLRFTVRLGAANDTGLPLDQRTVRAMLRREAEGKRFLNLFSRDGTCSVAAAAGGAMVTVSVDASRGRINRARRNFELNRFGGSEHQFVCQDPLEFVRSLARGGPTFDLVFCEPPRFDGRRREGIWNVQDGYAELVRSLVEQLSSSGKIYFVTSFRRLRIDPVRIPGARVREITRQTVPPDFRSRKIHRGWSIVRACDGE